MILYPKIPWACIFFTAPHPSSAFTWTQGVIQSDERWDETYIFSISLSPHRLRWHHHAMRPCQGLRTGNQYPQSKHSHNITRGVAGQIKMTRIWSYTCPAERVGWDRLAWLRRRESPLPYPSISFPHFHHLPCDLPAPVSWHKKSRYQHWWEVAGWWISPLSFRLLLKTYRPPWFKFLFLINFLKSWVSTWRAI